MNKYTYPPFRWRFLFLIGTSTSLAVMALLCIITEMAEVISDCDTPSMARPNCAAAGLRMAVQRRLNVAAWEEARAATDAIRVPSAEPEDYEVFTDDDPNVEFVTESLGCMVCGGSAVLSKKGFVEAPDCMVSGSCEVTHVTMYPERYVAADTLVVDKLPCGADRCDALLALMVHKGDIVFDMPSGQCIVDVEGERWRNSGETIMNNMHLDDPDAGFERYDGEQL